MKVKKKTNDAELELRKFVCRAISEEHSNKLLASIPSEKWDKVYLFLKEYNLIPLCCEKINQCRKNVNIPDSIYLRMRDNYLQCSALYLKRSGELNQILKIFNQHQIDVIPLKGAYLAETAYHNSVARQMSDMDLLVKEKDLLSTISFLNDFGYKEAFKCSDYKSYLKKVKHAPPFKAEGKFSIEIHLYLCNNSMFKELSIKIDDIWKNAREISLYNHKCFEMPVEDLIVYLSIEIAGDRFQQKILQLYDILLLLRTKKIEWVRLFAIAKKWNAEKILYSVLLSLSSLFEFSFPHSFELQIKKGIFDKPFITKTIVNTSLKNLTGYNSKKNKISELKLIKGFPKKLRYINAHNIFSRDVILSRYGEPANFAENMFFCFLRLAYLVKKYHQHFFDCFILHKQVRSENDCKNFSVVEDWLTDYK